jgi:hypothetical protein
MEPFTCEIFIRKAFEIHFETNESDKKFILLTQLSLNLKMIMTSKHRSNKINFLSLSFVSKYSTCESDAKC